MVVGKNLLIILVLVKICFPFRNNFIWGVTSAAYSIEGEYNGDGKGLSTWDLYTHKHMNETGDISSDSYNNLEGDINLIKKLNVTHYKFSISWSRILPQGNVDVVNENGLKYYERLIDGLIEINVQPIVTMLHYDIPLALEDMGGWMNDGIVEYFYSYAQFLFDKFGDKVKYWITIEDPYNMIMNGYGGTMVGWAPGGYNLLSNTSIYNGFYNILKSHGKVGKLYKEKYRKGMIGISFTSLPMFSLNIDDGNENEMFFHLSFGLLANPIFSRDGNYPNEVLELFQRKTYEEGRSSSRLRLFTIDEIKEIRNSSDFIGLNYYNVGGSITGLLNEEINVNSNKNMTKVYNQLALEINSVIMKNESENKNVSDISNGLKYSLTYIKKNYLNIPILITGNGVEENGNIDKIEYMKEHLKIIKNSIRNNFNIIGYCVSNFIDGFEWDKGYSKKMGLYEVDFENSSRKRTPRKSSFYYMDVIKNNGEVV
uniref:Beta-glucosidase n=1 Tax=Parastrongyloides trichosuri TaxID=131310 RepID=A0A0N4ZDP1_PARTI